MITDLIINVIMAVPYLLLAGIEVLDFNLTFPADMFEIIKDLTIGVGYVVPLARLFPIFLTSIGIAVFKVIWSITIRIKSFIPTMGS